MGLMWHDVYLAGPFFTPEQKGVMATAKGILTSGGCRVCDPQDLSPVIVDMDKSKRTKEFFRRVYQNNLEGMKSSFSLVAYTDGWDPGTMFEIGYFARMGGPIYTFSTHNYGANVMISQASHGHMKSLEELFRNVHKILAAERIEQQDTHQ